MKLIDLPTKDLVKLLVVGPPGSGKTILAAGFPYPIKYLDFDNKVSSAARYYQDDKERLANIDVVNLSAALQDNPMTELMKVINEFVSYQRASKYPYKTLVLDSITTFSSVVLQGIMKSNPGINRVKTSQGEHPGLQDYGILKREFQKLIPGLLTLDINVVMTGHVEISKDDTTGELIYGVQMDGSFAQQLPIYFEEVYVARVEEQKGERRYLLQTQSDAKFKCRSQIPKLPAVIPASYNEIIKQRP